MKRWYFLIAVFLFLGGFWLWRSLTQPVPGQAITDMGREHVSPEVVAQIRYNSNPPTSGPHLSTWVRAGIYAEPQNEGELIHALEHGYIIISYNCGAHLRENSKSQIPNPKQIQNSKFNTFAKQVFAHEEEGSGAADLNIPREATGSAINESEGCQTLLNQLTELAKRKKLWKLIIVPRPNLDTTLALTAWGYLDKFDNFDASRIEKFIDFHRDQGPEKTME